MDISHYYIDKGTGNALILLHGNGENNEYFVHQVEAFSSSFRVIALDTRGHGNTPRGKAPFTIRQFADDLADFMDIHKIASADIVGFSDGANIAMCFASKYPQRVNHLILNSGNLNAKGLKLSVLIPIEIGYAVAKLFAAKSNIAYKSMEMLGLMKHQPDISVEELKKISAQTLVIAGTNDMIKREHTEFIAEHISNSSLCFVKGNHFIANKKHNDFNRVLWDFYGISNDIGHTL